MQKLKLNICYMYDVPDDGASAKGGDVAGLLRRDVPRAHHRSVRRRRRRARCRCTRRGSSTAREPIRPATRATTPSATTCCSRAHRPGARPACRTTTGTASRAGPFAELAPGERPAAARSPSSSATGQDGMLTQRASTRRGSTTGSGETWTTTRRPGRDGKETCLACSRSEPPLIWKDPVRLA